MDATDASTAAWSTGAGSAQYTVLRMRMGGSAGLSTMIALPRSAPPMDTRPCAVVSVNSSMLARVPGPAERDATVDTISAYATGDTARTAATMGMVAWPPHVIMLRFGASRCAPRLTGGTTAGPTAAGVRSMATMPASA